MAAATVFRGYLLARRASVPATLDDAIDVIRQDITQLRPTHAAVALPLCLAILAEQLIRRGSFDDAIAAVDEGLSSIASNGNTYAAAELHRLRAQAVALPGEAQNGETPCKEAKFDGNRDFVAALNIARAQGAETLEWRVLLSMAHRQRMARNAESEDLLQRLRESVSPLHLSRLEAAVIHQRPGEAGGRT